MLALYRSGRQAEALEVYQDARAPLGPTSSGSSPGASCASFSRRSFARTRCSTRRPGRGSAASPSRRVRRTGARARRARGRPSTTRSPATDGCSSRRGARDRQEPARGRAASPGADAGARVLVGRCWEAGGPPPTGPGCRRCARYVARARARRPAGAARRRGGGPRPVMPELRELFPDLPGAAASPARRAPGSACSRLRACSSRTRAGRGRSCSCSTTSTRRTSPHCCCCASSLASWREPPARALRLPRRGSHPAGSARPRRSPSWSASRRPPDRARRA